MFFNRVVWGRSYQRGANMCQSILVRCKLFPVSRSVYSLFLCLFLFLSIYLFIISYMCLDIDVSSHTYHNHAHSEQNASPIHIKSLCIYVGKYACNSSSPSCWWKLKNIVGADNLLRWNFIVDFQVQAVYNAMRRDERMKYFLWRDSILGLTRMKRIESYAVALFSLLCFGKFFCHLILFRCFKSCNIIPGQGII